MDEIMTYDEMVQNPVENGLCDYCDLGLTGPEMCECRCCGCAYEVYLKECSE